MKSKEYYKKPDAVKHLENIIFEIKKQQYANFPYPIKDKYRDDNANGLTRCIIDYLRANNYQAERINSTGRFIAGKWIKSTGSKGTADISATIKGKSVKIEVKIGKDKQSQHQINYQKQIETAGGIYIIAKNFTDFYQWFRKEVLNELN